TATSPGPLCLTAHSCDMRPPPLPFSLVPDPGPTRASAGPGSNYGPSPRSVQPRGRGIPAGACGAHATVEARATPAVLRPVAHLVSGTQTATRSAPHELLRVRSRSVHLDPDWTRSR